MNARVGANTGSTSTPAARSCAWISMSVCVRGGLPAVVTKRNERRCPPQEKIPSPPLRQPACVEQAAGLRRSVAVGAPVRLVVAALGQVQHAIEHASGGVDLAK